LIEAFEIGVSLALRDGVSDSIAQAQRNVEALQKAVDANGLSVRALRDAGARAVSLVSVQPQQEKVQRKPHQRVADAHIAEIAPARADISQPVAIDRAESPALLVPERIEVERIIEREPVEAAGDRMMSAPVNVRLAPRDERSMEGNDVAPSIFSREGTAPQRIEFAAPLDGRADIVPQTQPVAPTAQPEEQVLSVPSGVGEPLPVYPGPQTVAAPEGVKAVLSAVPQATTPPNNDFLTLSLSQSNFSSMSFGGLTKTGSDDLAPVAQGVSDVNEFPSRLADRGTLESSLLVKPAAPDINSQGWPAPGSMASRDQDVDDPGAQGDWYSSLTTMRTGLATTLPRADTAPQSVAPQARGSIEEPPGGDVYLDGVLVGRWMSRFLKREAERADSGPTGFDARRGRLLPGVTVGG
jgi:hypothetical protein